MLDKSLMLRYGAPKMHPPQDSADLLIDTDFWIPIQLPPIGNLGT